MKLQQSECGKRGNKLYLCHDDFWYTTNGFVAIKKSLLSTKLAYIMRAAPHYASGLSWTGNNRTLRGRYDQNININ